MTNSYGSGWTGDRAPGNRRLAPKPGGLENGRQMSLAFHASERIVGANSGRLECRTGDFGLICLRSAATIRRRRYWNPADPGFYALRPNRTRVRTVQSPRKGQATYGFLRAHRQAL